MRLDFSCAEAKPPLNSNTFPKSDLVKIDQEMRWMIIKITREEAEMSVVGGVLIAGFEMYILKMELVVDDIYCMVQSRKTPLFKDFQGLVLLPNIVSNIVQLKVRSRIKDC